MFQARVYLLFPVLFACGPADPEDFFAEAARVQCDQSEAFVAENPEAEGAMWPSRPACEAFFTGEARDVATGDHGECVGYDVIAARRCLRQLEEAPPADAWAHEWPDVCRTVCERPTP